METREARKARLTYYKEWRSKNKEKVRRYNQRYWMKKARTAGSNPSTQMGGNTHE